MYKHVYKRKYIYIYVNILAWLLALDSSCIFGDMDYRS